MIPPKKIIAFQTMILERYAHHKRQLPRRDVFDPYAVVVSEVMLQQTQVDRVIPKYLHFLQQLPDFWALAWAEKKLLLELRSGLGFNSRVLRLQQCAQCVLDTFGGVLPQTREELRSLPGIGAYSSASILAFAFNLPAAVIDTNIRRVLIHAFALPEDIGVAALEEIALSVIPTGKSNDRHNALMDYGSQVATAQKTWIKPVSKQSKFEGSPRQVRGGIVKRLVTYGPTAQDVLEKRFAHPQFETVLTQLLKENMVHVTDGVVSL